MKFALLDNVIHKALKRRKKVELFLCNSVEGGFGIKIDGKIIERNIAWEIFEYEVRVNDKK